MKPAVRLAFSMVVIVAVVALADCIAAGAPGAAPEPGELNDADQRFFAAHPDLRTEVEVVKEASRLLAAEAFKPRDFWEASEALAAKAHKLLALRTPEEWQRKAVSLYPALGVAGSEFNTLFLKHYHEMKVASPLFADEPSWPVLLAKRCDDELKAKPAVATTSNPLANSKAPAAGKATAAQAVAETSSKRPGHPWQTGFAVILLLFGTVGPSFYVFRKLDSRFRSPIHALPRVDGAGGSIWRIALKHAAFLYVVAALPAAVHSLGVNADLGFVDRFVVSFFVGSLFGIFVTLPLFAIDALWQSLHVRLIGPAGH